LGISDKLSARIAELIDDYSKSESAMPELRILVDQERVLPICFDMGGVFTVDVNGEVRSFLWDDTLHGQVEFDPRIRNNALFQGSKKYPELASLIEKPETACSEANKNRQNRDRSNCCC